MSGPVIIRLQHLPLEARSVDIRKFFEGLVIPDGGVHIIGGERGDAFIAFQCDEDARLAMARDGNLLCNAKIKLFLSSKNEMQSVITAARSHLQQLHTPVTTAGSTASPLDKILRTDSQPSPNFAANCSYKDVRAFLQGVQIEHNGIKFVTDATGGGAHNNGQAFVRLVSIVDLKKALCRHGQFYDDRQIEVVQSGESEIIAQTKKTSPDSFYIKIYGLPARFDQSALKNMFNNVRFVRIVTTRPMAIQSKVVNQDGSQDTKTVMKAKKLCELETQLDVERALTRQDERVGKSRVQIFQISRSEFERELATVANWEPDEQNVDNADNEEDEDDDEFFVLITGLAYSARLDDVRQFLKGINAKEICLLTEPDTLKPLGECVCELYTKADRDAALAKSDSVFRNRVVKVKQLSGGEHRQLSLMKPAARSGGVKAKPALLATPASLTDKPKLNSDYEETGVKRAFAQAAFASNKRAKAASPIGMDLPPLPAELQKYKNSIVLLSNVSYEATREDILELFKYYAPIEQTLKIRHDDRGQPTGDAIVACQSHDEASKACRSLNGAEFMGQSIRAVLISP
ncbi:RNA-binding 12 [Brachionus plicatilis]|uniref:RNA-binding 12 n=1 Tax=Brachionus plicatilis TaxID=10195 RepID=A0A3M7PYQ7_BRAPC|nr:RNA-binding 12 [Brachionus plicatilis]